MHQVFQISRAGSADTLLCTDDHYILITKAALLLIAGSFADGGDFEPVRPSATMCIEDKAGTYMDAVDGELSGNAVEHGGRRQRYPFSAPLRRQPVRRQSIIGVAGSSQSDVQDIHTSFKQQSMEDRLQRTRTYWQQWLSDAEIDLPDFHKLSLQHGLWSSKPTATCGARYWQAG